MDIYLKCAREVQKGTPYSIDFKTRTLKLGSRVIIDQGKFEGEIGDGLPDAVIVTIDMLYQVFKHSIPSEKSESKRKTYFKALPEAELDDDDMLYGIPRMEAMFDLEFYVLQSILNGSLKWREEWGTWFWQSENDKDLVILREWVDGE